jgi:hypothetical protein
LESQWVVRELAARRVKRDFLGRFDREARAIRRLLSRQNSKAVEDGLRRAINLIGLFALRPPTPGSDDDVAAVQTLVWSHLEKAFASARIARDKQESRSASRLLRKLGQFLAGTRLGPKGRAPLANYQVSRDYHVTFLRLARAKALLRAWPWGASPDERIGFVAEACGLSREILEFHFRAQPRKTTTLEEAARVATARKFGVTQYAVKRAVQRAASAPYNVLPKG